MLKMICGAILCVCLGYIGLEIKKVYAVRVRYLEDYTAFINELIEEISFFESPIGKFVEGIKEFKKKEFRKTLDEFEKAVSESREFVLKNVYLNKRDVEIIQNCFNSIGKTDAATQLTNLKNSKIYAEGMLKRAEKEYKTKGQLYGKLGILLGLAVMIIVV